MPSAKATREKWLRSGFPGSYSSAQNLAKSLSRRSRGAAVRLKQVAKHLEKSVLYQAHRDLQEHFPKRTNAATSFGEKWEADLGDFGSKIAPNKPGTEQKERVFLIVVDIFSRKIFARGMRGKSGNEVIEKMTDIFEALNKKTERTPALIETDAGREFNNRAFDAFCARRQIRHSIASGQNKARSAERAVRSLKRVIMGAFQSGKWPKEKTWDSLVQDAAQSLNGRFNRSIKMTPDDVASHYGEVMRSVWASKKFERFGKYLRDEMRLSRGGSFVAEGSKEFKLGATVLLPRRKQRRAEVKDKEFEMHYYLEPMVIERIYHFQKPALFVIKNPRTGKIEKRHYYARELRPVQLPKSIDPAKIGDHRVRAGKGLEYFMKDSGRWVGVK